MYLQKLMTELVGPWHNAASWQRLALSCSGLQKVSRVYTTAEAVHYGAALAYRH